MKQSYFEIKTLSGVIFRGWRKWKSTEGRMWTFTRTDDSTVTIPALQVACLEELPEGHPRIPEWAVNQLAQKAER